MFSKTRRLYGRDSDISLFCRDCLIARACKVKFVASYLYLNPVLCLVSAKMLLKF